jgi:hypothetical protein
VKQPDRRREPGGHDHQPASSRRAGKYVDIRREPNDIVDAVLKLAFDIKPSGPDDADD